MNDVQKRINLITQILASDDSKAKKATDSLQTFGGMDITHFDEDKTQSLHKYLSTVNRITARYSIKTSDDYQMISDGDLNKILKSIQQLCLKLLID